MNTINLNDCSKDAETCLIDSSLFEADRFEEQIVFIDTNADKRRQMLGDFVTACVNGNCPGQNPELARQIMERRNHP